MDLQTQNYCPKLIEGTLFTKVGRHRRMTIMINKDGMDELKEGKQVNGQKGNVIGPSVEIGYELNIQV